MRKLSFNYNNGNVKHVLNTVINNSNNKNNIEQNK